MSLSRLRFTPGSHEVVYVPKAGTTTSNRVRHYGAYSNATRGKREKAAASAEPSSPDEAPEDAAIPDRPYRAALRRRWAVPIRRV